MDDPELTKAGWGGESMPSHIRTMYGRTEQDRACVQILLQLIVEEHGINPDARHVEIGCGVGELFMLLPHGFGGQFTFLDYNWHSLRAFQTADWTPPRIVGDAHVLPLPSNHFDYTWGYASYDTFFDLPRALQETARVLDRGGLFIHVVDIDVGTLPVVSHIVYTEGLYPLPSVVGFGGRYFLNGMYVLTERQFARLFRQRNIDERTRLFLKSIEASPVDGFSIMIETFDAGGMDRTKIVDFAQYVKRHSPCKPITFRDFFQNRMVETMPYCGLEVVHAGGIWTEVGDLEITRGKTLIDHGGYSTTSGFGEVSKWKKNTHVIIGRKG